MQTHRLVVLLSIFQVVIIHVNGKKTHGSDYYPAESFPKYPPRTDLCQTLQPRPDTSADTNKALQPSEPNQQPEPNEQHEPEPAPKKKKGLFGKAYHKLRSWLPLP